MGVGLKRHEMNMDLWRQLWACSFLPLSPEDTVAHVHLVQSVWVEDQAGNAEELFFWPKYNLKTQSHIEIISNNTKKEKWKVWVSITQLSSSHSHNYYYQVDTGCLWVKKMVKTIWGMQLACTTGAGCTRLRRASTTTEGTQNCTNLAEPQKIAQIRVNQNWAEPHRGCKIAQNIAEPHTRVSHSLHCFSVLHSLTDQSTK